MNTSTVIQRYGNRLSSTDVASPGPNRGIQVSSFKHIGINEISQMLDHDLFGSVAQDSKTNPQLNTMKNYMYNVTRQHVWRNNAQAGQCELKFYVLRPRNHIPVATSVGGLAPANSVQYSVGGIAINPTNISSLNDEAPAFLGGNLLDSYDYQCTPYMIPTLTELFKIKRLKVAGPTGRGWHHRLLPGQECRLEGKYKGPMLVNFNKFGMTALAAQGIANVYEVLKQTPLVWVQMYGTVSHNDASPVTSYRGIFEVDYVQMVKWCFAQAPGAIRKLQVDTTTDEPTMTDPEQGNVMTGQDEKTVTA